MCHSERNEVESKNPRTDLTTALDKMRKSFDALTLAQDDKPGGDLLFAASVDSIALGTDGYDMKRNILAAVFNGGFYRVRQTAAAGDRHPGNGD